MAVVGVLALAKARTWALAEAAAFMAASEGRESESAGGRTYMAEDTDAPSFALSLDLEGHGVCAAGRALLAEVPASDGLRMLGHWWSRVEEDRIIFDQGWGDEESQDGPQEVVHAVASSTPAMRLDGVPIRTFPSAGPVRTPFPPEASARPDFQRLRAQRESGEAAELWLEADVDCEDDDVLEHSCRLGLAVVAQTRRHVIMNTVFNRGTFHEHEEAQTCTWFVKDRLALVVWPRSAHDQVCQPINVVEER